MRQLRSTILTLSCLFLLVFLLAESDPAAQGVRRGISVCTKTLFPALFPVLVLSELLIAAGAGALLGRLLGRPVAAFFGISDAGASALLLGGACGLPITATTAVALFQKGEISQEELRRLMLFANNPSPGFLIAATGIGFFRSAATGAAIFCITILSSILLGWLLRIALGKVENVQKSADGCKKALTVSDFTEGIHRAFFALLGICAFVLFFFAIVGLLEHLFASSALPRGVQALFFGMLELTAGITYATATLPAALAFRAVCFFSAFGGLCVSFQILSATEGTGVRLAPYLLAKAVQGVIALLLADGYLRLFSPVLKVSQSVQAFAPRNKPYTLFLMLALLLLLLFAAHRTKRKKARR